jgi:hypothetical protein
MCVRPPSASLLYVLGMGQSITPRQRVLFAVFLLALLPAGNALQPRLDEDTWWHLAVGQYVVEHRTLPETDPFSRLGQEQHVPWVAYSWLHEVALYGAYSVGGYGGVLAFRHLLDSLTFVTVAWFVLRRTSGDWRPIVVLALVTATLIPMMLERPWHYTIAFTTLTLHAVLEMHAGASARRFWWLVPVFALWANLHIQFVLGLGLFGLGLGLVLVNGSPGVDDRRRHWLGWLALAGGCAAATLVNPYHVRHYGVVWEYATQTGALKVVSELAPPDFGSWSQWPPDLGKWWNWPLAALLVWGAVMCIARRFPVVDTAILVIGAAFALRMQRDVWFGAVMAAAVLIRVPLSSASSPIRVNLSHLVGVTLAALVLTRVIWHVGPGIERTPTAVNNSEYPAGAVEFLRTHRPPGPLYNHFNWGGYLIWTLPEYPVGIDGRTNLYGEERLDRAFRAWLGDSDADPELAAAGVVLAPKKLGGGLRLTDVLRADPRWKVAYEDDVAIVFVPAR